MPKSLIRNFALAGFVLASGVSAAFAQPEKNPSQNPSDKPRNVKKEPANKAYRDWVSKDVAYIITKDERKAFLKLTTDEERENFIENFWRRRDPNPDTEENEYREEFYERIAYANEHFSSGIPGWKSDRGRVYITFGKPDSVESHPSGGAYDRPSYEGGGSTTTYPFEVWFYRHLDSVGEGIEVEFVDPTGTGEYRIARSPYEKDAMAMVPGAGLTTAEQLGLSDKSQRNQGIGQNFMREQDNPFRRMEIIANLQRPPQVKFSDLQANLESPVIDNNPLDFDLRVDFFRQSDERVVTAFTIQTDNKELVFEQIGGLETARMNIFGRITAVAGKRSGIFEDSVTTNASPTELAEAKDRKSIYQKAIALTPGTYKVDVVVRDVSSGSRGIRTLGFTVPKYEADKLSASSLILASKLYSTTEKDIGSMFVVGNAKVVPNLTGVYKRGQEVGIYMQIYNAGIDQTTLRPSVDVDYVLLKDGKEVFRQKEDWQGLSDSGQRLTIARLLPTTMLPLGEYEIKISIRDRVNDKNKVEGTNAKFSIVQ
ncbi:MAG TPA: GWxTD domain-containing protein [Pyrinomonadaceae bacterium]|jgi:GWxTD domain-containing protein